MIRALYALLMWLLQPLLRIKLARRARAEPLYGQHVAERFGQYDAPPPASGPRVWVHAVSLGETRAAAVLIAQLREHMPGMQLLLTHGTATGRAEGQRLLRPGDIQVWQPWDTVAAVRAFYRQFRPQVGVLMETEVWPNLVAGARAAGVPLVLANARLSDKSLRQALRVAALARPAFGALHAVLAQTEDDARRLRELGADVRGVFGNLKFDATPDAAQLERAARWREATGRPVLMLASSREGEEAMLLDALGAASTSGPATGFVPMIVPRHPQRFDEVAALASARGWQVHRRSQWGDGPPPAPVDDGGVSGAPGAAGTRVLWLGDSLGEMNLYYGLASVALLGGSFAPLGGQNLIEAAACGCPLVMGPHTFNFGEAAAQSITTGAGLRAPDMAAGVHEAAALLADAPRLQAMAQAARSFSQSHRGAAARYAQAVAAVLSVPAGC